MTIKDRVYDHITLRGPVTNTDIWRSINAKLGSIRHATNQLEREGLITKHLVTQNGSQVAVYRVVAR